MGFWLLLRRKRKRGAEKIVEKDFLDFFWIFLFFWRIHILVEPTGFGSLEREIERDCGERKERKKNGLPNGEFKMIKELIISIYHYVKIILLELYFVGFYAVLSNHPLG